MDQRGTRSATVAAIVSAGLMIAQQVGGKATRDALFLAVYSASELPKAMLATSVLSLIGVVFMARAMVRFGPARVMPVLFLLSAAASVAEWFFIDRFVRIVAVAVYLHVAVVGALLISGFWSVVSERFDPHTAKKVIARIGTGATVGGLAGGVVAERVAAWFDARLMLLVLAGLHVACAIGVLLVGAPNRELLSTPSVGFVNGVRKLAGASYLKTLGLLAALTALTSGVVDFAFKASAANAFADREQLMSFFAIFYTGTSLLSLVLLSTLGRRALARLGIGGTVALMPVAVILTGVVSAAVMRMWSVVMLRAAESAANNAFYRPSYELLFTPVPSETKRATKTVIDVGFNRLGDALASGAILLLLAFVPGITDRAVVVLAVAAAGGTLLVAVRLHRGYVEELARNLRAGTVDLADTEIIDATTRRTMSDSTLALDRDALLAEIAVLRGEVVSTSESGRQLRTASSIDEGTFDDAPVPSHELKGGSPEQHALHPTVMHLLSGDARRIRACLQKPVATSLVGLVIPLLEQEGVARDARRALGKMGAEITGQLVDALCSEDTPAKVRRRLPGILKACESGRALRGLVSALSVGRSDVRERSAAALGDFLKRHPDRRVPLEAILNALQRESERDRGLELDYAFQLLSLVLDSEPLKLSLQALRSDDAVLRGTSLEYLENVLPPAAHKLLWPQLEKLVRGAPQTARVPRSTEAIETDLKAQAAKLRITASPIAGVWYRRDSTEPDA